jgi:nitrous oxidase accessory protein
MKPERMILGLSLLAFTLAIGGWAGGVILTPDPARLADQPASRGWEPTPIMASSPHVPILIDGDAALDAFCTGNASDGLTLATAHVIRDYAVNAIGSGSAIAIQNTKRYLVIENCTATGSGGTAADAGIKLANCTNVNIKNNTASSNGNHGIYLSTNCDNNTISGNIANNNKFSGIFLEGESNGNVITNNTVNNNLDFGISLYDMCDGNVITNNTVNNNMNYGIFLYGKCDGNVITNNTVNNNMIYGILLDDKCDGNVLTQNLVYHNKIGLYLAATTTGNVINHNRLLFNRISNAMDNGTANSWDNGTAGNYWGDYEGYDADGDGIGETWYAIPGAAGAQDMYPFGNTIPGFSSTATDLAYEIGTTGHEVSWFVTDCTPWLLSYTISIDDHVVESGGLHGTSASITASVDGLSIGTHDVMIEVTDGCGSKNIDNSRVTVVNTAPSFTATPIDVLYEAGSVGNVVSWIFVDPSVVSPTYSISRDGVIIIVDEACAASVPINLSVDGLAEGTYTFAIEIEDGLGGTISGIVHVDVTTSSPKLPTLQDFVLSLSNSITIGLVLVAVAIIIHGILARKRNPPTASLQGAGSKGSGRAITPEGLDGDAPKPKTHDG